MSKYIEVEKAMELCDEFYFNDETCSVMALFDSAPTIDIVRCKECEYAHMTYGGECKYCDMWKDEDDNYITLYLDGDYYCADGKRKES